MTGIPRSDNWDQPIEPPEIRLIRNIIGRAVWDYIINHPRDDHENVLQAGPWIFSPSRKPWSFLWCCEQVAKEGAAFAKFLRKEAKAQRGCRRKQYRRSIK